MLRALILLLLCAAPAIAQQVVTFDVSVFDDKHQPAAGLSARDFRLFEDGVERRVVYLTSAPKPLVIGIVFDNSGSMRDHRRLIPPQRLVDAVEAFLAECVPQDAYFLVQIGNGIRLASGMTRNPRDILSQLASPPTGRTELVDGIMLAISKLSGRMDGVILAVTDGDDNASKLQWQQAEELLRKTYITFIALNPALPGFIENPHRPFAPEKYEDAAELQRLVEVSGGISIDFRIRAEEMIERTRALSRLLHHRYTLGYVPSKPPDGKWRDIRVQLQPRTELKRLKVAVRRGYYAAPR